MSKKDEALKLALEALEIAQADVKTTPNAYEAQRQAIAAIRKALADSALDRMAENARELGLDYEPAPPPECQTEAEATAFAFGWFKALEQKRKDEQPAQQQEPVAWVSQANLNSAAIQRNRGGQGDTHTWSETPTWDHSVPLYTSPQPSKPWVGLTDVERAEVQYEAHKKKLTPLEFMELHEAKLREKNTGEQP